MTDTFYKIPQNWRWTTLENVAEIIGGGTPSSKNDSYYEGGEISWITPADLSNYKNAYISRGAKNITELGLKKSSARLLPKDTVCLSTRAPIGYVAIAKNSLSTNQGFKNFLPSEKYLPKYLYWYLKGNTDTLKSFASGTTFLELSKSRLGKIPIPLPPLAEQKRIVERLDSLFEKLDAAKKILQDIVDGYEQRRAAILQHAFTGELTEDFRKKNNLSLDDWQEKTLGEIVNNHDYKRIPLSNKQRTNIKKIYDYYGASGVIDKVDDYIFDGKYLLIGEDGANLISRSKPIAFIANGKYWVNNHAHILSTKEILVMEFLCFYINYIDLTPYVTGSAQPKLTQKNLNIIPVPLPPLEEQKEISLRLDSLLGKENQAKEIAEKLLSEIETLKKTILSRAFRGELGTNNPSENAVENFI